MHTGTGSRWSLTGAGPGAGRGAGKATALCSGRTCACSGAPAALPQRITAAYQPTMAVNQIRAGGAAHGAGCAGRWPGVLRRGGEATVRDLTCVRGAKLPACAELS